MQDNSFQGRPDPIRAHGAWVYLFASVGAGALVGAEQGVEVPMLVGTAFAGGFLVAAAVAAGLKRKGRQVFVGLALIVLAPLIALWLGADRRFLTVAAFAGVPAILALVLEKTRGFLSASAMTTGIAALVMAAPTAAVAGGASVAHSLWLVALLTPVYSWRSLRIAKPLHSGGTWDPVALRARGLREAALAAGWSLSVAFLLRMV